MGVCGLGALLGVVVLASGPCSPSEGFECLQGIDGLAPESISDGFDSLDGLHGVEGSAADLRPARFMGGRDSREAGFAGVRGFALCGREPTGVSTDNSLLRSNGCLLRRFLADRSPASITCSPLWQSCRIHPNVPHLSYGLSTLFSPVARLRKLCPPLSCRSVLHPSLTVAAERPSTESS